MCVCDFFFFFKQKTAYEMLRSLVGSEMCIRDSATTIEGLLGDQSEYLSAFLTDFAAKLAELDTNYACLLYTSDAADDLLCVDLGGRRIIKKKTIILNLGRYRLKYKLKHY